MTRRPLFSLLAAVTVAIWISVLIVPWSPRDYEIERDRIVVLEGKVDGIEPDLEGDQVVWKMTLSDLSQASYENQDSQGGRNGNGVPDGHGAKVLCVLETQPLIEPGARVRVRGRLSPFRRARNEGAFDLCRYYHILRLEYSLRDVKILAVSQPADILAAGLYRLKRALSVTIDRIFSAENAPLIKAILLGEKGFLTDETKELYQGAGIIHILSISGIV